MKALELILYALGAISGSLSAVVVWVPSARIRRSATLLDFAGLAALAAAATVRGVQTGHPPVFGTFENTLASAWAILLMITLIDTGRVRSGRLQRALLGMWVPLTLGYGLFFSREPLPLTISERSIWIDVHVIFAWAAYALLLNGTMAALASIIDKNGEAPESYDGTMIRAAGVGFAAFSAMMAVGAYYTYQLYAVPLRWELVLSSSVVLWLGLGLVLHAWLLFGWHGRRLAYSVLSLLPVVLFSFWSWSIYSGTYHFFDIVPMKAM